MQTQVNDSVKESDTATRIVEAVAPAVQSKANRLVEVTHSLAHAAVDGLDKLSDHRQAALGACRDTVVANPLRAVGAAVLAGLVLGALMRR